MQPDLEFGAPPVVRGPQARRVLGDSRPCDVSRETRALQLRVVVDGRVHS
jgi:hypothetical protein